jgi:hypothetical protein
LNRHIAPATVALLIAAPVLADELLVPSQFPTIQAAFAAALPGDIITVAPGDYALNLVVSKVVTLRSSGGPAATTLRPANTFQPIVRYSSVPGPSRLEGFTLTGGAALFAIGAAVEVLGTSGLVLDDLIVRDNSSGGNGGGIGIVNSAVTITGCEFLDNTTSVVSSSSGAGAVYSLNSETQLVGCTFERNRFTDSSGGAVTMRGAPPSRSVRGAAFNRIIGCTFTENACEGGVGGAVYVTGGVAVDIEGCVFVANASPGGGGGAVGVDDGSASISECVFDSNITDGGGGAGVYAVGSPFTPGPPPFVIVDRCEFVDNLTPGGAGGGVRAESDATIVVTNSLFTGNFADGGNGPAASVSRATLSIINSTIAGNAGGGAVSAESFAGDPSFLTLANSIVRDTTDGSDVAITSGVTAVIVYSNVDSVVGSFTGMGNINLPVTFTDPAAGDYSLVPGSPGIDAGDNSAVPLDSLLDLAGAARFSDDPATADGGVGTAPIVDMGAYELQGPDCPADVNGDGMLTPADFSAWIAAFNAQAPGCDQNGDGQCLPNDFSAWVANFNAGC